MLRHYPSNINLKFLPSISFATKIKYKFKFISNFKSLLLKFYFYWKSILFNLLHFSLNHRFSNYLKILKLLWISVSVNTDKVVLYSRLLHVPMASYYLYFEIWLINFRGKYLSFFHYLHLPSFEFKKSYSKINSDEICLVYGWVQDKLYNLLGFFI